jgi:Domain of unknown function (DUF3597)
MLVSIFGTILSKLGIGESDAPAVATPTAAPAPTATAAAAPTYTSKLIPVVDVMSKLEKMAADYPEKLNWKTSIVDLFKLLGLDHSYKSRKELAVELGCPTDKLEQSAEMNVWLHKAVLIKIAGNGGNIPQDLLD